MPAYTLTIRRTLEHRIQLASQSSVGSAVRFYDGLTEDQVEEMSGGPFNSYMELVGVTLDEDNG